MARLTPEQWEDVKAMYATGHYVVTDIAQQFGVSHTAINKRAKQENWQKLDYAIVTNAINASAELKREVSKVSKEVGIETLKLETEIDRLARRKVFAESVGDKLLKAVDDSIPLCEKPSDVKDLATAFKSVYEPMFKTAPDTAIQINNNQTPSIIERVIIDHEATN
jgi:transposase-like protein